MHMDASISATKEDKKTFLAAIKLNMWKYKFRWNTRPQLSSY